MKYVFAILLWALALPGRAAVPPQMKAFVENWCVDCHDASARKGRLSFDDLDFAPEQEPHTRWVRVFDKVLAGEMPPKNKPHADETAKRAFLTALGGGLGQQHAAMKGTVMRRLNRTEYENTLLDLLGVRTDLKSLLPEDGKAFNFDNIGEALDLSPVHLQRYMDAASAALRDAVKLGPAPEKKKVMAPEGDGKHKLEDGAVVTFKANGHQFVIPGFTAVTEGLYRVTITGRAHQTEEDVGITIYAGFGGGNESHLVAVTELPPKQTSRTFEFFLRKRDKLRLYVQFAPGQVAVRKNGPTSYEGPALALMPLEVEGPIIGEWPGRGHKLLFGDLEVRRREIVSKDSVADARRLLAEFVPAAFRRPVGSEKIAPYLKLAQDEFASGATFQEAMRTAYVAVLCAPDFLYLREPAGKLDAFAIASRLSYMLWSTAPDAELIAAAAKGQLSTTAGLRAQTERLLKDARAKRFTEDFTGQWLNLRDIDFTTPDQQLYPEFNDALKAACVTETELFFDEVLRGNLSVTNFIDSSWTIVNEALARHYGISGVEGTEFRKVPLMPEHHRGGLLTQASVLKVSANGTTTSPVVRGAWVLDRILGTPPPPPPPGVPGVEPDIRGAQTLRQQLEKHRTMESCNACHRVIDPPGFALENYDVIGGWRENYRSLGKDFPKPTNVPANVTNVQWRVGPKVDASGTTPEGQPFKSLSDYKKLLLAQPARFTRSLAEKLAIYGTGRGMGFSDRSELDRIAATVAAKGNGFRDLVHEVVQSSLFQNK